MISMSETLPGAIDDSISHLLVRKLARDPPSFRTWPPFPTSAIMRRRKGRREGGGKNASKKCARNEELRSRRRGRGGWGV